jgi:hypothetical protein
MKLRRKPMSFIDNPIYVHIQNGVIKEIRSNNQALIEPIVICADSGIKEADAKWEQIVKSTKYAVK